MKLTIYQLIHYKERFAFLTIKNKSVRISERIGNKRGRSLFDKKFYNESKEKYFHQTIAMKLLRNFEL